MILGPLEISEEALAALCDKWRIRRLWAFGSVCTPHFGPDSDVDLLAEFGPGENWSLMDLVRAEQEFAALFGHRVDLVDRSCLEQSENWIRRNAILDSAEIIHAA